MAYEEDAGNDESAGRQAKAAQNDTRIEVCEEADFGHCVGAELLALVQEWRQHPETDFPSGVLGSASNGNV